MPDVQFLDLRYRSDGAEVVGGEPVAGVNGQSDLRSEPRGLAKCFERRDVTRVVREFACMQLDRFGPDLM